MDPWIELGIPLPDVLHIQDGEIRVKGHRITLHHILTAHNDHGISPHGMVFYYPTLSLDEIQRVLAFYRANRAAVDEYLKRYNAELDRLRAAGNKVNIEELRRRLEEKRRTVSEEPPTNGQVPHPADTETASN